MRNIRGDDAVVKVDDVLRAVLRAWLADDGFSADDMREARRRSLEGNPEQQAKKDALAKMINGRLAVYNRKREGIPTCLL